MSSIIRDYARCDIEEWKWAPNQQNWWIDCLPWLRRTMYLALTQALVY